MPQPQLLSINKNEDYVLSIRLFDALNAQTTRDISSLSFLFHVLEKGMNFPLITKENSDVSLTQEVAGYNYNILNVRFYSKDTARIKANPSWEDRTRQFKVWGIDSEKRKELLADGMFYIEEGF